MGVGVPDVAQEPFVSLKTEEAPKGKRSAWNAHPAPRILLHLLRSRILDYRSDAARGYKAYELKPPSVQSTRRLQGGVGSGIFIYTTA